MGKRTLILLFLINTIFLFASTVVYLKKEGNFSLYAYLTKSDGIQLVVKTKSSASKNTVRKIYANSKKAKIRYKRSIRTRRFYIKYQDLKDIYKEIVIKKLFPYDYFKNGYYYHKVRYKGAESLWRVAVWFTGDGMNYKKIKKINKLRKNSLYYKTTVKIPENLLLSFLKPEKKKKSGKNNLNSGKKEAKPLLEYRKDKKGEYAIYRLKKGEALYSAVVVRFTGRLDADSVMELAYKIAERSGIKDVTDIPVGYPIKIPVEYLLPEYKPKNSKEYKQYESDLKESELLASKQKIEKSKNLEGVYVILDPGHGGADTGAMYNGVWEDDYMYDIVCRIKRILETKTKAVVIPTVWDKSSGYKIFNTKKIKLDRDEYLMTTPKFNLNSKLASKVGVNLRWYLANYLNSKRIKSGVNPSKIVFISFHADALYKKVRGTMIYIPYAGLYRKKAGRRNRVYLKYYEVRVKPFYTFTKKEVSVSEGLSRKLAYKIIDNLKNNGITVHKEKPVREFIFRSRYSRPFVPAVIRYNKVMIKMLIEVGNLKNKKDAKSIANPEFREKFAETVVQSLLEFYGNK
ncbi:hypothetical protein TTHT_0632 [Thermotomaculum hydrothermale]|uniref:N-acetylmuramoyl-L-alanine amidase n=1 Tax=Thermotomaculum hydrothermale TaxID=981385 RepID=A0A7R6PX04_9BACT|nr:N-acetylmuramoyl-L-alanine amidase [Thermotomaculum hydrothermale]BBB32210.1 hypothetical protein TTHT_0632 [Thermotomaculum hydrothermale]